MSYKINYKTQIWEQIKLYSEEDFLKAKKLLEKGYQPGEIEENIDGQVEYDTIWDTSEHLQPSENDGYSTIELLDEKGNIVWQNGK